MNHLAAIVFSLALPFACLATDTFELIDGTIIKGKLVEVDSQGYLLEQDGGRLHHLSFAAVKARSTTPTDTRIDSLLSRASPPWLPSNTDETPLPELNRKMIEFCETNCGKHVGSNVCSELAVEAFRFAGISTRHYGWGRKLGQGENWMPGDVLQYIDVVLNDKSTSHHYTLHTSVVGEVHEDYIVVFEQYPSPKTPVQKFRISKFASWSSLPWVFRPDKSEHNRSAARQLIKAKVYSSGILKRHSITRIEESPDLQVAK